MNKNQYTSIALLLTNQMIPEDIPIQLLSRIERIDIFDIETLLRYAEYVGEDRVVKILQEVQEFILLQPLEDDTNTKANGITEIPQQEELS